MKPECDYPHFHHPDCHCSHHLHPYIFNTARLISFPSPGIMQLLHPNLHHPTHPTPYMFSLNDVGLLHLSDSQVFHMGSHGEVIGITNTLQGQLLVFILYPHHSFPTMLELEREARFQHRYPIICHASSSSPQLHVYQY
jgi:hypothetical protein